MSDLSFLDGVESTAPAATDEIIADAEKARDLGRRILPRYFENWKADAENLEVLATERLFERPLLRKFEPLGRTNISHRKFVHGGKIDLIARVRSTGAILGFDHKFFAPSTWSEFRNILRIDDQISGYFDASVDLLAEPEIGERLGRFSRGGRSDHPSFFDGFVFNVALKWAPDEPNVNKDGTLSVAKNQSTTPALFEAAVARQPGVDRIKNAAKYADFLAYLRSVEKTPFVREFVMRTPDALAEWRERSYKLATESKKGFVYRNASLMTCPRCPYKTICEIETEEGLSNFEVVDDVNEELAGLKRRFPTKEIWSYSRAGSFASCRKAHDYRFNRRLRPRIRAAYFRDGDILHRGLEAWYATGYDRARALEVFEAAWSEEFVRLKGPDAAKPVGESLGF